MQSETLAACRLPWCRVIHADTTPHNLTVGVENPASEPPALAGFAYPTLNLRFAASALRAFGRVASYRVGTSSLRT